MPRESNEMSPQKPSIEKNMDLSRAALNDLSSSLSSHLLSSEKVLDNFQQKVISNAKNFAPKPESLPDIKEDQVNEFNTSSDER